MANYFVHKHQVGLSGIELKLYINFEKMLLLDEKFGFKEYILASRDENWKIKQFFGFLRGFH